MANKRDLKKFIRNTCGALAVDMVLARDAFPQIDRKNVHNIVLDAARLQARTIRRVSIDFDRSLKDFADAKEYNKARSKYYREAYTKLLNDFDAEVEGIVKQMNAALPAEVKNAIKEAIN